MNYTDIYQKVAGLRRKAQPVKRVQTSSGGRETYRWESTMPEYLDKLAKEEFSDPQEQKLAALVWLLPEDGVELAKETAPGFLEFLKLQNVDTLADARAAAIAFGCGWRPDHSEEELPWADAVAELAYVAIPLVRQAVNQLQGWGISFDRADETDQLMWAQQSAEALCGNVDFEGKPYGKHQGTLHTFATNDCASIAFFTEKVRSSLWGYMSGRKISAEGFTSGILWHALRQEANQPPPQDRYHQGWIRFTEQLAICVSDDGGRDGRSLASSNGPQNLQGSIEIRDLKPGEKISVGKRIYKAALFDKDPFYRVKGENCYEQKRSARTGNRRSYLWLRKGFDLPMLPLDDSGLGELEHSGGGKHGTPQERDMIEEILEPENIALAWKRVKANKGAPGIDGMAVADFLAFAQEHWPKIASAIREGTYRPAPVRRVWITTPDGSKRPLGIPTVLDRVVQQAVTQVLGPLFEAGFSEHNEFDNENEED